MPHDVRRGRAKRCALHHGFEVSLRRRRDESEVADGRRGDRRSDAIRKCIHCTRRYAAPLERDPLISGGGVLIDNGTHSVDIMRYFLGPLAEIQVIEGKRVQGIAVEDTVRLYVRSSAGVMGNIDLSWSINKELPHYISIYGSEGTIIVGWKESRYKRAADKDWIVFGKGYDKVQAFASQLRNFNAAVRGREPLRVTLRNAARVGGSDRQGVRSDAARSLAAGRYAAVGFGGGLSTMGLRGRRGVELEPSPGEPEKTSSSSAGWTPG